jgi:hypothetical protein
MMQLYVIHRSSVFANMQELKDVAPESKRIGDEDMAARIRWIRSYVVEEPDHRLGTVCIYEANDEESIREHARRAGIPGDDTFLVLNSVLVRPDPAVPAPTLLSPGTIPADES